MKQHENKTKTKRIFFDKQLRLWTMQNLDNNGNQIDGCQYEPNRKNAFNWLNEKNEHINTQIEKTPHEQITNYFKITHADGESHFSESLEQIMSWIPLSYKKTNDPKKLNHLSWHFESFQNIVWENGDDTELIDECFFVSTAKIKKFINKPLKKRS